MAFHGSISGYLSLDCTLRVFAIIGRMLGHCIHLRHWYVDYDGWFVLIEDSVIATSSVLHWYICLRYLICWLWWLICLDWGFWDIYFLCASLLYLFRILTFWLYRLLILFRLAWWFWFFPWLFWSPCMYGFIIIYHFTWHVDSFSCILSWSSLSMMFASLFILIIIACMHTWVIYPVLCLTACCVTTLLLYECMSSVRVGHTSIPYLQLSWFWSFPSFRFSLLQVWGLVCVCHSDWARD